MKSQDEDLRTIHAISQLSLNVGYSFTRSSSIAGVPPEEYAADANKDRLYCSFSNIL